MVSSPGIFVDTVPGTGPNDYPSSYATSIPNAAHDAAGVNSLIQTCPSGVRASPGEALQLRLEILMRLQSKQDQLAGRAGAICSFPPGLQLCRAQKAERPPMIQGCFSFPQFSYSFILKTDRTPFSGLKKQG